MKKQITFLAAIGLAGHLAFAQQPQVAAPATSESRDAATAFIGAMQFTVGRVGRDCLALLGRSETPQYYAGAWQQRSSAYVNAAAKYLQARVNEAESKSEDDKKSVMQDLAAIRGRVDHDLNALYGRDGKEVVCKRMVALIDGGQYDITPRVPMFKEIEALVAWAQK